MGSDGHRAGSDLFVCFPSRATISLMPKPILSPGRSGDGGKRVRNNASRGQSSPMFSIPTNARSSKKNNTSDYDVEEPTSPKVTCAGQVRVKPAKQCKNWQSVMAEIEKLHNHKHRKRGSTSSPGRHQKWSQVVGLKKEVVQFITALRNLRVDFGCFGAPAASTDDEEEEDEEEEAEAEDGCCKEPTTSGTVFAKWFMMLQDNDDRNANKFQPSRRQEEDYQKSEVQALDGAGDSNLEPAVPPPNALLLMRCRSAPSTTSLNMCASKVEDGNGKEKGKAELEKKSPTAAVVLRRWSCDPPFSAMLSMDVSKETWVNSTHPHSHSHPYPFVRSLSLKAHFPL